MAADGCQSLTFTYTPMRQSQPRLNEPYRKVDSNSAVEQIFASLRGLQFGSVELTIHEGRIVQIERRDKQRFNLTLELPSHG